jgi:hypothetical protein
VDIVPDDNAGQYEEEEDYDTATYILNEVVQVL